MRGPVAPKDPTKKRSGFYIMRDKEVVGGAQKDGSGVQFIYLNDGRLLSSAEIVGGIKDRKIKDRLCTTEGFRKMVHSIGVTIAAKDREQTVRFVLQMYGLTHLYNGGTNIMLDIVPDGAENIIEMSDVDWSLDDDLPGQIRFEFSKAKDEAVVSVKFYLNDGFEAPDTEQELPVDFDSEAYKKMIACSLMQKGNNYRIKKALQKAERGEEVTIAFIGGSITQGAGATPIHTSCYAYRTFTWLKDKYGKNIKFVKAGVGGTPSELGMIRYDRDVLRNGTVQPDIVIIEFAVNDEGDETKGICFESIAKKALMESQDTAVILLFAVFADDFNLQERLSPIGKRYKLPMISVKNAVSPQFMKKRAEGGVLTKNQYFYDRYHPSNNGHIIMADCITNYLDVILSDNVTDQPIAYQEVEAVLGDDFYQVHLLDRKDKVDFSDINPGSFLKTDTDLQCVEMDDCFTASPEFPYNWSYQGEGSDPFSMDVTVRSLLLIFKDSGDEKFGKAEICLDDKYLMTCDPHINGWTHCNAVILFNETEVMKHKITIRMASGDENKCFTILGFGYCR